jgi:uncharacterized protein
VHFEYDATKSEKNRRERGLPFVLAARLFEGARLEWEDRRKDYGEIRFSTLGEIEGSVFFVTYTRRGEAIRIISFRRASPRETRQYRSHIG